MTQRTGWANVGIAALAMVGTLPGRTQGLGLITEPLVEGLGIDRVDYATVNLWATLIGALFCIPFGRMFDRLGARVVLPLLLAALGLATLGMTWTSSIALVAVGITLTRGFGQSALSVASLALVGKWFPARLGMAMGVYSFLVGAGFIGAFPSVGAAVLKFGWRGAWAGVGWALMAMAVAAGLLVRNPPRTEAAVEELAAGDLSFGEALRGPAFWVFAASSAVFGLAYSGIALFNQSILEQRGFDASIYHTVLAISAMLGLVTNFAGGWLSTRWPLQRIMGIGMGVLAAALVMLPLVRTNGHVYMYGVAMGAAGGIVTVVFFTVWGQMYGRSHLGRIQGSAQMMTVVASAVGPVLLAQTLRDTGSYDGMFYLLAVVVAGLAVASTLVPAPVRRVLAEAGA